MPPYFVPGKNGELVKFKIAGMSPTEAEWGRINTHLGLNNEPNQGEEPLSALGSGWYGMSGAMKTGVGTGIAALGFDETGQEWIDAGTKDVEDAQRRFTPTAPKFEDIQGIGDLGSFVYENTLSSIPYMAPMIAGGIAGIPGGPWGMGAGALAGGTTMYQGINTRRKAEELGLQPQDVSFIEALPYSIAEAAADAVLPYALKLMGNVGKTALKSSLAPIARKTAEKTWGSFVKNVSSRTIEAALIESGTETFQQALEILHANPDKLWKLPPESRSELINAAAAGFFVGGLIGGTDASVFRRGGKEDDRFDKVAPLVAADAGIKATEQANALRENSDADIGPYQSAVESARLADEEYRAAEAARSSSIEAATKAEAEEQAQRPTANDFAQSGVNIVPLVGKDGAFAYEVRSPAGEMIGTAPDAKEAQKLASLYRKGLTGPRDPVLDATLARLPLKNLPADTRKAIQLSRYTADPNADVDAPVGWEEAERTAGAGALVRGKLGISDTTANLQVIDNTTRPEIQVEPDAEASPVIPGLTTTAPEPKLGDLKSEDVTGLTYEIREEASGTANLGEGKTKNNVPHQVEQGGKKFFFPNEKMAKARAEALTAKDPDQPVTVRPSRKAFSAYEVGTTTNGNKVQRFLGSAPTKEGAEAIQSAAQATRADPGKWKAAFQAAAQKAAAQAEAAKTKRTAAETLAGQEWEKQQQALKANEARNVAAAEALGAWLEKLGVRNATLRLQRVIVDPKDPNAIIEGEHFDRVITLATDIWRKGMTQEQYIKALMGVMNHELIHHLFRVPGLISPTERKALHKYVARTKARVNGKEVPYTWLERASVMYAGDKLNDSTIIEEAIAEAFRSWVDNRNNVVAPQAKTLFQRIMNFFKEFFAHKNKTAEQVFTDIIEGRKGDEGVVADGVARQSSGFWSNLLKGSPTSQDVDAEIDRRLKLHLDQVEKDFKSPLSLRRTKRGYQIYETDPKNPKYSNPYGEEFSVPRNPTHADWFDVRKSALQTIEDEDRAAINNILDIQKGMFLAFQSRDRVLRELKAGTHKEWRPKTKAQREALQAEGAKILSRPDPNKPANDVVSNVVPFKRRSRSGHPPLPKADSYGGILINDSGQVLLREPANHYGGYVWTFAKGTPDFDGEDATLVARREVQQETGYDTQVTGTLPQAFQGSTGTVAFHIMKPIGEQGKFDWETSATKWVSFDEAVKLISMTTNDQGRKRDLEVLQAAKDHLNGAKDKGKYHVVPGDEPGSWKVMYPDGESVFAAYAGGDAARAEAEAVAAAGNGDYMPDLRAKATSTDEFDPPYVASHNPDGYPEWTAVNKITGEVHGEYNGSEAEASAKAMADWLNQDASKKFNWKKKSSPAEGGITKKMVKDEIDRLAKEAMNKASKEYKHMIMVRAWETQYSKGKKAGGWHVWKIGFPDATGKDVPNPVAKYPAPTKGTKEEIAAAKQFAKDALKILDEEAEVEARDKADEEFRENVNVHEIEQKLAAKYKKPVAPEPAFDASKYNITSKQIQEELDAQILAAMNRVQDNWIAPAVGYAEDKGWFAYKPKYKKQAQWHGAGSAIIKKFKSQEEASDALEELAEKEFLKEKNQAESSVKASLSESDLIKAIVEKEDSLQNMSLKKLKDTKGGSITTTPSSHDFGHVSSPKVVGQSAKAIRHVPTRRVLKLKDMKKVGEKPGGSNPGAVYQDAEGNKWLVKGDDKHYGDLVTKDLRARNEALGAALLNATVREDLRAPNVELIDLGSEHGGGTGVAVEWKEGLKKFDLDNPAHLQDARDAFLVHAWLANWDALGMGYDNIMQVGNQGATTIDMGGSLFFRAQGAMKYKDLWDIPEAPGEFDSMRGGSPEQAKVYKKIEQINLERGANLLRLLPDIEVHRLVAELMPVSVGTLNHVANRIIVRKNEIVRLADIEVANSTQAAKKAMGDAALYRVGSAMPVEVGDTLYNTYKAHIDRILKSDAFKKLYRNAATFDPSGRPLIFYRAMADDSNGPGRADVNYFDPEKTRNPKGIVSLSTDPKWAIEWKPHGTVYPVVVAAKRVGDFRRNDDCKAALAWIKNHPEAKGHTYSSGALWGDLKRGYWGVWEDPAMLDALGWDAVYMLENQSSHETLNIAVRNAMVIKSIFNQGTWDPTIPNLLKSRSSPSMNYARQITPNAAAQARVRGKWMYGAAADLVSKGLLRVGVPQDRVSKIQNAVDEKYRVLADKMLPLGRLVDAIFKAGGHIEDQYEAYLQGELLAGRTGDMLRVAKESYYDPMVREVANMSFNKGDVDSLRMVAPNFAEFVEDRLDNLQMGMANAYIAAKHAPERNALIQARTPGVISASGRTLVPTNLKGSGFDTVEANRAVAWFERHREAAKLREVQARVKATIAYTNLVRRQFYLTPDFNRLGKAEDWQRAAEIPGFAYLGTDGFQNYVPLRGLIEEDPIYDPESAKDREESETVVAAHAKKIRGKEDQNALGRGERPPPLILEHMIAQNMSAIIRGQQNHAYNAFITMLEKNKGLDIQYHGENKGLDSLAKIIDQVPVTRTLANGIVKLVPDTRYKNARNVLVAKRPVLDDNGQETGQIQEVAVEINNEPLRAALIGNQGIGPKNAEKMIYAIGQVTRFMAKMATQWNPLFLLTNFPRDLGAAAVNLQQYEIEGLTKEVFKNVMPAMRAIWNSSPHRNLTYAATGKDQATRRVVVGGKDWTAINEEFMASGGDIQFWGLKDLDDIRQDINNEIMKETPSGAMGVGREAFKRLVNLIEANNKAVESAVRLATYEALISKGLSQEQAAQGAKNVTVNFDKGGEAKGLVNSLYMFYNASLQGSLVIASALARSKKVRRLVTGIVAYGVLQDLIMSAILGEDDKTGMLRYDQIPDHVLSNRMILPDPSGRGYLAIPMPYGYNAFHNFGRALSRTARGKYDTGQFISTSLGTMVDAFNPVGGTSSLLAFASPTILDPFVEIAQNTDFAGRKIYPEGNPFGVSEPPSRRHFTNTNQAFVKVSEFISNITGGEEYFPGMADNIMGNYLSPDTLEYLFEYYLSGVGSFVNQMGRFSTKSIPDMLEGEEVSLRDVPVASKFAGNFTDQVTTQLYYEARDQVGRHKAMFDAAVKSGDPESIRRALTRDPGLTKVAPKVMALDAARRTLNSTIKKIEGNPRIPDERKREILKPLKERRTALEQRIVKAFNTKEEETVQ